MKIWHFDILSTDFIKDFILYTFASDISYATILTQLNQQNSEVPISFMSSNFKGAELNYHEVDKQAFAIFKVVKHFHPYLFKPRTKVIVPFPSVRNLLLQKDLGEKRAPWMTALQEYDLEIKPSTIVNGQGLCKLIAEAAHIPNNSFETVIDEVLLKREIYFYPPPQDSWYIDLRTLLETGTTLDYLEPRKRRALRLKYAPYLLIDNNLFRRNSDGVLLCCLDKDET